MLTILKWSELLNMSSSKKDPSIKPGRFIVTIKSIKHITLYQAYQGPSQAEAELIARVCLKAINASHGSAEITIYHGKKADIQWICRNGYGYYVDPKSEVSVESQLAVHGLVDAVGPKLKTRQDIRWHSAREWKK